MPIKKSSWVALRIYPSSHTNPVFVVVGRQADPGVEEVGRMVPEVGRSVLVAEGAGHSPLRARRGGQGLRQGTAGVPEDRGGSGRELIGRGV